MTDYPLPEHAMTTTALVDPVDGQLGANVVAVSTGLNALAVSVVAGGSGGGGSGTGTNGSTAPTTSVSNGYTNGSGNQTAVSPSTPLPTSSVGSAWYCNQVTAATGTSTAPITAQVLVSGVNLYAPSSNTAIVYAGPSGVTVATGFPLLPGGAPLSVPVNNTSLIYLISGTTGQLVNYAAV